MLTGGSGGDQLFGQAGNDMLLGKGGNDFLFGGAGNDVLTGGDADDQVFGEAGDDRFIWNPGDDTDLYEGGAGIDTDRGQRRQRRRELHRSPPTARACASTALDPAPFALDIGTMREARRQHERRRRHASRATGNLAALIGVTVDGGAGNDTILGSNGTDLLIGGDGNDFIDGQQGNDIAFLGAGNDVFQWDPGDGSDVVEGQDGTDTLLFNGSAGERDHRGLGQWRPRALHPQRRQHRHGPERRRDASTSNALGGADTITVNDLRGTDVDRGQRSTSPARSAAPPATPRPTP